MKINTLRTSCLLIAVLSLFLINCAGTHKNEEESFADETDQFQKKNQQEDLDDIEALLGIKTEESTQKKTEQPPKKQGEQLQLLDTKDYAKQETTTQTADIRPTTEKTEFHETDKPVAGLTDAEKKEYEARIKSLETQIRQKDDTIQELNTKLNVQSAEITQLSEQPKKFESARSINEGSGSEYQSRYDEAHQAFEQRNYQEAIGLFESLLSTNARHSLSDNAQYWIGECHFALKQYDAAIMDFEKVSAFTNSNKRADAQFKLGMCYFRKGNRTKAMEEWDRLRASFPNSEFNARAQSILSKK